MESPDTDTRHTIRDINSGEAAAILESIVSNARQLRILRNGHGGEAAAIPESIFPNARHTFGNINGGEAAAIPESIFPNARHTIRFASVGDGRGNGDHSDVLVAVVARVITFKCYHHSPICCRSDVIVDTIHLKIMCIRHEAA